MGAQQARDRIPRHGGHWRHRESSGATYTRIYLLPFWSVILTQTDDGSIKLLPCSNPERTAGKRRCLMVRPTRDVPPLTRRSVTRQVLAVVFVTLVGSITTRSSLPSMRRIRSLPLSLPISTPNRISRFSRASPLSIFHLYRQARRLPVPR